MDLVVQNLWAAAGSVSQTIPAGPGGAVALPAVDAGNLSLLVTNNGSSPAWFNLQNDQVIRDVTNSPGSFQISPGASLLFAPSAPSDYPNAVAASATFASVAAYTGGSLTFTRGTVTTQTVLK
jgi:hypothetical protein